MIDALKTTGIANYAIQNNSQAEDIDFVSSLTLSDMRGKVIIVWGSNEAYSEDYPFLFRRNNDSIKKQVTNLLAKHCQNIWSTLSKKKKDCQFCKGN